MNIDQFLPPIAAAVISAIVSGAIGWGTYKAAEEKVELDYKATKERLEQDLKLNQEFQLVFAAERVAQQLLREEKWRLRTFDIIKYHLGGFSDDELRKILVRAGAIRFESEAGVEFWGLADRNRERFGDKPLSCNSCAANANAPLVPVAR